MTLVRSAPLLLCLGAVVACQSRPPVVRPSPALDLLSAGTWDALERLLPSRARLEWREEPDEGDSIRRFFVTNPERAIRGEALPDGSLDFISELASARELPAALSAAVLERSITDAHVERQFLLAYELADHRKDGSEHEVFVDAAGRTLFEYEKPPEEPGDEIPEAFDELSSRVRRRLGQILGDNRSSRLQREIELGTVVHAARWKGHAGRQEVKLFEDAEVLYLELPPSEPIPPWIREVASGRQIEAIILAVWSITDVSATDRHRLRFLANGLGLTIKDHEVPRREN